MKLFCRKPKQDPPGIDATIPPKDEGIVAVVSSLSPPRTNQPVELGTINYVNITPDGRHGDLDVALRVASETGKPIFAKYVGCSVPNTEIACF